LFTRLPASETGVDFINALKETPDRNIFTYEYIYNGGGVAVGDINNDSLPDIYLTGNFASSRLYLNEGNMHFRDITEEAGVSTKGWCSGVTMADVNEDGWLDIYVCRSAKYAPKDRANLLFINNGDLNFTEQAVSYGIDEKGHSTVASFFDYDRDGHLDLYVGNHQVNFAQKFDFAEDKLQNPYRWGWNRLYHNNGDGTFTDVTESLGLKDAGFALSVTTVDINLDGWTDIYVANDYIDPDYMLINQGDGTFRDELADHLFHISNFGMGADIADYNNDTLPDIIVLDMLAETNYRRKTLRGGAGYDRYWKQVKFGFYHQLMRNTLQLNNGNGTFSEIGQLAGISATDWSWTPMLADFDADGWKDLLVTNGYRRDFTNLDFMRGILEEERKKAKAEHRELDLARLLKQIPVTRLPNYVFRNNADLTFTNETNAWGLTDGAFSMGSAYADLDGDGDLDLVMNNIDDTAFIYRNNARKINWLKVRCKGSDGNTFGLGAKVWVKAGGLTQYQELMPVRGYQSSQEPVLYFGLGKAGSADEVRILWPNGHQQVVQNVPAGKTLVFRQEDATDRYVPPKPPRPYFTDITTRSKIDFRHRENEYNDFRRQPLLPHKMSQEGPALAVGDVNGDGLDDIFIGGAYDQAGMLYVQTASGRFRALPQHAFETDKVSEDISAVFLDADGDGDADLYVMSGGGEFVEHAREFPDRLYLNDGSGRFTRDTTALPAGIRECGSIVRPCDFDGDGDLDLFAGTLFIPGRYPLPASSFLLENDGGTFHNVTASLCSGLQSVGMVRCAVWTDVDSDGKPDLVISGEWMPLKIFRNTGSGFEDITAKAGTGESTGWWFSLAAADLDGDGDQDLVAGNRGLNDQIQASDDKPAYLYADDFDANGQIDPLICAWFGDTSFPVASRDEFRLQMQNWRNRYPTYASYAKLRIKDILKPEQFKKALYLEAKTFRTAWFENDGRGHFTRHDLPFRTQFSPVQGIIIRDFTGDGHPDILLAGNYFPARAEAGRYDASIGVLLKGDGSGHFKPVDAMHSGISLPGDVRRMALVRLAGKRTGIAVARNDNKISLLEWLKPEER